MKYLTRLLMLLVSSFCLGSSLYGQEIPTYRSTILIFDSLSKEPIDHAEVEVFALLPTGERLQEYHSAAEEIDHTEKYPIGTELSISIRKTGYYRKILNHQVRADPTFNERDAYLWPSSQSTVNLILEGDLIWNNRGVAYPAQGESIMIQSKNGVRKAQVSEGGHFLIELEKQDYYGKDSLQLKVGYNSGDFYPIEIWIKTKEKYQFLKLEIKPKALETFLEIELVDSLDRNPIENALVKIYYRDLFLGSGHTDPNGRFGMSRKLPIEIDELRVEVTRDRYQKQDSIPMPVGKLLKVVLMTEKILLKGRIQNTKGAELLVILSGEGFSTMTTHCMPSGEYEFPILRSNLLGTNILVVEVINSGRMGRKQINTSEFQRTNVYNDLGAIDSRKYASPWNTRLLCSVGFSTWPYINDNTGKLESDRLGLGADLLLGIKPIPRVLFGLRLSCVFYKISFFSGYIWTYPIAPVSILLRYTNGLFRSPKVRFFIGPSIAAKLQTVDLGVSLALSRRTSFDFSLSLGNFSPLGYSTFWASYGLNFSVRLTK